MKILYFIFYTWKSLATHRLRITALKILKKSHYVTHKINLQNQWKYLIKIKKLLIFHFNFHYRLPINSTLINHPWKWSMLQRTFTCFFILTDEPIETLNQWYKRHVFRWKNFIAVFAVARMNIFKVVPILCAVLVTVYGRVARNATSFQTKPFLIDDDWCFENPGQTGPNQLDCTSVKNYLWVLSFKIGFYPLFF